MLDDAQIETMLRQRTRFRRFVHEVSCTSTQDLAAAAPRDGDAAFWADHQTAGRGRQQREWHDEPGVDVTLTLRATLALPQPVALPAALPVAVLQACETFAGQRLTIKWPNDLFLEGRKLSGVLVDAGVAGPDSYLIGIGVNCNRVRFPRDLEATATSLALATGHEFDRGAIVLALAERVDAMLTELAARQHDALEALFRDRLGLVGQRVVVTAAAGEHTGALTSIDFQRLVLDGERELPLAIVRGIVRA